MLNPFHGLGKPRISVFSFSAKTDTLQNGHCLGGRVVCSKHARSFCSFQPRKLADAPTRSKPKHQIGNLSNFISAARLCTVMYAALCITTRSFVARHRTGNTAHTHTHTQKTKQQTSAALTTARVRRTRVQIT